MFDKEILKGFFHEWLDKNFGGSKEDHKEVVESTETLVKNFDEEKRMALFIVSEPDVYDLHNTSYTTEEIEKACINFNTHCNQAAVYHAIDMEEAYIVQSFVNPVDFTIQKADGSDKLVKAGTWLQWWKFPENETGELLWSKVKSGELTGVSISARAKIQYEE